MYSENRVKHDIIQILALKYFSLFDHIQKQGNLNILSFILWDIIYCELESQICYRGNPYTVQLNSLGNPSCTYTVVWETLVVQSGKPLAEQSGKPQLYKFTGTVVVGNFCYELYYAVYTYLYVEIGTKKCLHSFNRIFQGWEFAHRFSVRIARFL